MTNKYSRREAIKLGAGTAVLGIAGSALSAATTQQISNPQESKQMSAISEFNKYGEELENILILRTSPIAVKMLEKEEDIPKRALRPYKDRGHRIAQCQAFAYSRRDGLTVAMLKEDNHCPTSVVAYGLEKKPAILASFHPYNCFEHGKYIGIVSAPLRSATFMPDVVIAYLKPSQLRSLFLSLPFSEVPQVSGHFFPPSCGWSVVEPMLTGKYWAVVPDPGEYQRALTDEGDMMVSIPRDKMPGLMTGMSRGGMFPYREHQMFMLPNFEQPQFYKDLFKSWGIE